MQTGAGGDVTVISLPQLTPASFRPRDDWGRVCPVTAKQIKTFAFYTQIGGGWWWIFIEPPSDRQR